MTVTEILWRNRDELFISFHIAIIIGIQRAWQRCRQLGANPQEPDLVAGLVLESSPIIYSALKKILTPLRVSVSMSSVFCHQTPQVTFNNSSASCELGDILFIYVNTRRNGQINRNAILFQAKASSKQPYKLAQSEQVQLRLYMDWPDFVYTRSSRLNGQSRSISPKSPHAGAQYLLIDDRTPNDPMSGLMGYPGTYPIGCCIPDFFLHDHNNLAMELFNLFTFRTGRAFNDQQTSQNQKDWSTVIWDLIETGVLKSFNRKKSGIFHSPRAGALKISELDAVSYSDATSSLSCTTASQIIGHGNAHFLYNTNNNVPPQNRERNYESDEFGGGVSVILIETSERESE